MYQTNQFPSYDAYFSYLCSSALGLVDQGQRFGTTEQQPIYQGIPVQVLNPISIYNSGPDTYQNEANHSYSLNKYHITSLTNLDSENASGTGIQEIPQSILDEYVPYRDDYESVKDRLLLTPSTPFQQLISWDELEIREQTTANHTSSGIQLTNLPVGIHSSQDLRPVAVVNPLCMHQAARDNQTTQAEVNVDGSSSLAESERECYQTDPTHAERKRGRERERYQTDPAYAERKRKRERERYQTDPAYAERQRVRKREHQRELRKDPAYAERKRKRERERYQTDPAYAERQREHKRELRRDPAYAEGQKIYIKTYKRIKIQTSNKEEAKKQAVIARERYLQSVNSAKNSGDLPLTSNFAETTQSSSKNSEDTASRFSVVKLKEYLQSQSPPLSLSERSAI
ncbi:hypothetical protein [Salinisphaera sp. G21_0]|uniref:hypothetical protein n=1 Tax=Salinisphaera sp. G21_0 TaxID=2821094 RepID=UPI001AD98266|nr:hypothetical protein [Salinisphaera sp. G21_0]MBO9484473.1 hypothetical protein [Salinisphaera sp. G21_0]